MSADDRSPAPRHHRAEPSPTATPGTWPAASAIFPLDHDGPGGTAAAARSARHRSPGPAGPAAATARRRRRLALAGVVAVGAAVGTVTVASGADSPTVVADDAFGRTVASGWGTAPVGGGWSATAPLTGLSVQAKGATVTLPAPRSGRSVWLSGVSAGDVSARADVTFLAAPTGNGQIAALTLRKGPRQQEYRARVRLAADRSLRVSFSKVVPGRAEQVLGSETLVARDVALGTPVALAAAVEGDSTPTLTANAWPATAAKPSGWAAKVTDGTDPVTAAGTVGLWFYSSAGQTGSVPLVVTGLRANDKPGAGPIDGGGAPRPVPTLPTLSPAPTKPSTGPTATATPTSPAPTSSSDPAPVPPVGPKGDRPGAGAGAPPLGSTRYPTPADAVVVSPAGNDAAAGTAAAPFRTITRAVSAAPSGATIALRGGTYHERVQVNANKRVTIQNWPGEAVWLDGSVAVDQWVQDGATWRHDGWTPEFDSTVQQSGDPDFQALDPAYPLAAHPDQVFLGGRQLTQVGSRAAVRAGTFYVDYPGDKLYIGSSPAGQEVRASDLQTAIYLNKSVGSTVRGIGVRRYATSVNQHGTVKAFGDNETLADMHVESNAVIGVGVDASNVKILNNTITGNGQLGLNAHHSDGLLVRGNVVNGNNTEHFKQIPVAGGIKVTVTRNLTISDNSVVGNGSTGIWVDESCWNATITRNDVRSNTHHGIYFELSARALIADNVVADNTDSGIRAADSAGVRVWNNTVLRNRVGIEFGDGPRVASNLSTPGHDKRRALPDPDMTWVMSDMQAMGNVMDVGTRTGTAYLLRVVDGTNTKTAEQMRITADHNLFLRPSAGAVGNVVAWSAGRSGTRSYATVDAFRSATGQEARGSGQDVATATALVGSAADGNLGLRAGNPAKGKGAPLAADVAAAISRPAGGSPDPGAFFG